MDFIKKLPSSSRFDTILVIVNWFIKQAIFIPAYNTITSVDLACLVKIARSELHLFYFSFSFLFFFGFTFYFFIFRTVGLGSEVIGYTVTSVTI